MHINNHRASVEQSAVVAIDYRIGVGVVGIDRPLRLRVGVRDTSAPWVASPKARTEVSW